MLRFIKAIFILKIVLIGKIGKHVEVYLDYFQKENSPNTET